MFGKHNDPIAYGARLRTRSAATEKRWWVFVTVVMCAAVALLVPGLAVAAGNGNSDAAHRCQQGGWQTLYRSDGTGFKNTGDCVSYAAGGGTFATVATVTGTVTRTNPGPLPPYTRYVVGACPGTSIQPDCVPVLVYPDAAGHYSMTLPSGTYTIVGGTFLAPGGRNLVFADQGPITEVVHAGQVITLNWTVTLTTISGTVTPIGAFPPGATYGVVACPPDEDIGPMGCPSMVFTGTYDGAGDYALALTPGTWKVLGYAVPSGTFPPAVGATEGVKIVTLSVGQNLTFNWTVAPPA